MKKLLINFLTCIITITLLILGLTYSFEESIINTISDLMKNEVANIFIDVFEDNTNINMEEVKKRINAVLENNETIRNAVDNSFDKALDMLISDKVEEINLATELEEIINESEIILKDYGVTIKEEDKRELLNSLGDENLNKELNDMILEVKSSMPMEAKTALNTINFLRSVTFKIILIVLVAVNLLFIALLKKSYYKWLGNLAGASIICGLFYSFGIPYFLNIVSYDMLKDYNLSIKTNLFSNYGYVLLTIGIIAIIANVVIFKFVAKNSENSF